jgi:hypothetical protein
MEHRVPGIPLPGGMEAYLITVATPELVRKGGLEPPRPYGRSHLKAVRLPISPLPLVVKPLRYYFFAGAG